MKTAAAIALLIALQAAGYTPHVLDDELSRWILGLLGLVLAWIGTRIWGRIDELSKDMGKFMGRVGERLAAMESEQRHTAEELAHLSKELDNLKNNRTR